MIFTHETIDIIKWHGSIATVGHVTWHINDEENSQRKTGNGCHFVSYDTWL